MNESSLDFETFGTYDGGQGDLSVGGGESGPAGHQASTTTSTNNTNSNTNNKHDHAIDASLDVQVGSKRGLEDDEIDHLEPQTGDIAGQQQQQQQQPPKKKRSRQVFSCTFCQRRKQKCDKVVPCANCIKRGKPEECHIQVNTGSPEKQIFARAEEVAQLREHVAYLDAVVAQLKGMLESTGFTFTDVPRPIPASREQSVRQSSLPVVASTSQQQHHQQQQQQQHQLQFPSEQQHEAIHTATAAVAAADAAAHHQQLTDDNLAQPATAAGEGAVMENLVADSADEVAPPATTTSTAAATATASKGKGKGRAKDGKGKGKQAGQAHDESEVVATLTQLRGGGEDA